MPQQNDTSCKREAGSCISGGDLALELPTYYLGPDYSELKIE